MNDGDGTAERLGWTNPSTGEAFLWIDLIPNHFVDDGRELFGVGTLLSTGRRAQDGFEALRAYDAPENGGNGDGVITVRDRVWGRLRVWIDRNHDGFSQADEIGPLQSIHAAELRANPTVRPETDVHGNVHGLRSTYLVRESNALGTRLLVDVFFRRYE